MEPREAAEVYDRLLRVEQETVRAYDSAIPRMTDGDVERRLRGFRGEHVEHVRLLGERLQAAGPFAEAAASEVRSPLAEPMRRVQRSDADRELLLALADVESLGAREVRSSMYEGLPPEETSFLHDLHRDHERHASVVERAASTAEEAPGGGAGLEAAAGGGVASTPGGGVVPGAAPGALPTTDAVAPGGGPAGIGSAVGGSGHAPGASVGDEGRAESEEGQTAARGTGASPAPSIRKAGGAGGLERDLGEEAGGQVRSRDDES